MPHHNDDSSNPVIGSFVNEKGFSFCECATLEDVDAVIALDGIDFMGNNIKMRRHGLGTATPFHSDSLFLLTSTQTCQYATSKQFTLYTNHRMS